jgi:hypothetical protein
MNGNLGRAEQDLDYVRRAIHRDAGGGLPVSIALVWAAISLAGFTLLDFAPRRAPAFWAIAAPAGFLASVWLGRRRALADGRRDEAEAGRWLWHWLGLGAAIGLAFLAPVAGVTDWEGLGATILLLLAVAYLTAGVHLHRPLVWVAAVLAAGYLAVLFAPGPKWTVVGLATAAALLAAAGLAGRESRAA